MKFVSLLAFNRLQELFAEMLHGKATLDRLDQVIKNRAYVLLTTEGWCLGLLSGYNPGQEYSFYELSSDSVIHSVMPKQFVAGWVFAEHLLPVERRIVQPFAAAFVAEFERRCHALVAMTQLEIAMLEQAGDLEQMTERALKAEAGTASALENRQELVSLLTGAATVSAESDAKVLVSKSTLPPMQEKLLGYFRENQGKPISLETLAAAVWQRPGVPKGTITSAISAVRQNLAGPNPATIEAGVMGYIYSEPAIVAAS